MNAYVDQNFLINCANNSALKDAAIAVAQNLEISFVLSPWHFYEVGSIGVTRGDELILIADCLQPKWILDRSDLQLGEFQQTWNRFWGMPKYHFDPIADLSHVTSTLLRTPAASLAAFSLADYARVFRVFAHRHLLPELRNQEAIAASNQGSVREGKMTPEIVERINEAYVALMLGRVGESGPDEEALNARVRAIRKDSFTEALVQYFVKRGAMESLRAWKVEAILTDHHHSGTGRLDHNKLLDRQHAVVALAYCDRFITDDRKLLTLCTKVRNDAGFSVAEAQTANAFIASLTG
jgi:hypothetical protein